MTSTACMHEWMQVADANSAVRLHLCMEYFSTLKQLANEDLSGADRASLQQQLDDILFQTQSRSVAPRCCSCTQPRCQSRHASQICTMLWYCLACWHMLPDPRCKQSSTHPVFVALFVNHNDATSSCRFRGLRSCYQMLPHVTC